MALQPPLGQSILIIEVSQPHSDTPHSVGLLWKSRRNLYLTTHKIHKAWIDSQDGIRNRSPSKETAAEPHLRLRDHWCRRTEYYIYNSCMTPADSVGYLGLLIILKVHFHHDVYHICCQSIKKLGSVHNVFFFYRHVLPSLELNLIVFCCFEFLCFY
jgi:hypothetical protein